MSRPTRPRPNLRDYPNPVAVFGERFLFTTLTDRQAQTHSVSPYRHPKTEVPCILFSMDNEMSYTAFSQDFGPLNLAFVFDACEMIHAQTQDAKGQPLCIYTSPESKSKSNMALMVSLYCLIVDHAAAWEAFAPIAEMEFRPFRDAGWLRMEFGLSIQDCLYGMDKALSEGLLDLANFDVRHYRYYEIPQNGDLNVLGPFVPFASPIDPHWTAAVKAAGAPTTENMAALAATRAQKHRFPNHAFKCVSRVFREQGVGLVVRLNDELYDRRYFTEAGIDHVDMYFDDGSNPSDDIVRAFIRLVEDVIETRKMRVAVHCKAGLGRTGILIGAYFIYKYGFSAQEVMGFMRIVRPGMVVGPQQQYMVANQMKWVTWAARDALYKELKIPSSQASMTCMSTPPLEDEPAYPPFTSKAGGTEVMSYLTPVEELRASTRLRHRSAADEKMPVAKGVDAIGQPRKGRKPVGMDAIDDVVEQDEVTSAQANPSVAQIDPVLAARGVKRGAGRAPLGTASIAHRSAATLEVPSSLARSSSTSSVGSAVTEIDDREHKRRPTGSSDRRESSLPRTSPSVSRSPSPRLVELESAALSPSRNKVNLPSASASPLRSEVRLYDKLATSPARNAAELQRPTDIVLSPSSIPVPRRLLSRPKKSPEADIVALEGPSTPERAKTKSTVKQAEVVRAGKSELKEIKDKDKKAPGSPRFAVRLLSRFGAGEP